MENSYKSKKNNTIVTQLFVILIIVVSLLSLYANNLITIESISTVSIISFIVQIAFLIKVMNSLLNPVIIFSVILHLFSSGQIFLYVFNIERGNFDVYNRLNQEVLISAIIFVTVAYSLYQLGVIIIVRKVNPYAYKNIFLSEYNHEITYKVGLFLFAVSVIPYMYNLLYSFIFVTTQGYSSFYEEGVRLNNLFAGIGYYIYPGLVFIIVGGKRLYKKAAIIFLTIVAVVSLFSGDRGTAIVIFLSAYMLYVYFLKDGKYNKFTLVILLIILAAFVPIIAVFRHNATIAQDVQYFEILSENNVVISTLDNLGGTLWPLGKVMELIPHFNEFLLGRSYLASIVYLIPSFLRIGPLNNISEIALSPANWLMESLNMTYGPGFTPFAEAYLNFGWFGIFFMVFFGIVFAKLLTFKLNVKKHNLAITYGIGILNFLFFAMSARSSINVTLSYFIRYVLFPLIILNLTIKQRSRKI